jgi:hypothetical protein
MLCPETLVHKIQTPGNHPKEGTQLSEYGEHFEINHTGVIGTHRDIT